MTVFEITILWIHIAPSYYWLMYAIAFLVWYQIIKNRKKISWNDLENLFLYIVLWVIVWWRLWYIMFYNFSSYLSEPLSILKVWEWWMSFHGWVLWVIISMMIFSRIYKVNFYKVADQVTLILPIWLWLWRIWNYLNGELLWYSGYNWFLAVYKDWIWYFPSPLLEWLLEWLVLYFVLLFFYKKKHSKWQIASLFLIFYSIFRIFVEFFFRTPDSHIWYILWYFTMWEILSFPMFVFWVYFYFKLKK